MPSLEVLAVLADEVADVVDGMSNALGDLDAKSDGQRLRDSLEYFTDQVGRIEHAAEILELPGLKNICTRVKENIARLENVDGSHEALSVFMLGPNLILEYLRSPRNSRTHTALVSYLADSRWPQPLTDAEQEALAAELAKVEETPLEDEVESARPTVAQPEDVALAIGPDVNPAMAEAFIAEAPLQAGAFSSLVEQILQGEPPIELLNEARRLVHSIKGAATTVGVRGIANLTHHLEDLIEYLAEHTLRPEGELAGLFIDVSECLESMVDSLVEEAPPPGQAQTVLQRVLDAVNAVERGEPLDVATAEPRAGGETALPESGSSPRGPSGKETNDAAAAPAVDMVPKVRVPAATVDELLRLSGEMTTSRAYIEERLHQAAAIAAEQRERHATLQDRVNEIERMVTVQGSYSGRQSGPVDTDSTVRSLFDALELDRYSELHGSVHGFVETIADLQVLESRMAEVRSEIEAAVNQETMANSELHEHLVKVRMVPATTIEPRLARAVRQVCEATGKQARLSFEAGDVMLDDHMISDLINPLTHLLRNAVDHGLEDPNTRTEAGKPPNGEITLSFTHEGNHVIVQCADDGMGLDLAGIRAAAVERGLIPADATLDDDETARLILLPAFSTRTSVSEISGRGVGMDIVHSAVQKLKGTVDIATTAGKGTRFILRFPMTMGTAHCLLVRSGGCTAALPTDFLDRAVYQGAGNVQQVGDRYSYREGRESLEVHDLAHLLGLAGERSLGDAEDTRPVIVVNDPDSRKAVVVDALLAGRDLVIKSLGPYLQSVKGVIGASVLGDGQVLQVLDIHQLLRMDRGIETSAPVQLARDRAESQRTTGRAEVLVVDDSLTVRQTMTQLLTDDGYEVSTARDGLEALERIEKSQPAALLIDLEMPRLNGLELTTRLRASESTRRIPIIMVTSRSGEKHREQARLAGVDVYITKPYKDEELLGQLNTMLSKAA